MLYFYRINISELEKMIKKIFQAYIWLLVSSLLLFAGIWGYYQWQLKPLLLKKQIQTHNDQVAIRQDKQNLIRPEQSIKSTVESQDARAQIVANFLEKYNSPLKPYDHYGQVLVETADKHQLDFRLLPAIMMQESNLCAKIPEGSYNCLGFGIHSGGTLKFDSYEANFDRAARELKNYYVDEGRLTVLSIAQKYTASVDSWVPAVNQFMAEMKYDDRAKGIEKKIDANVLEYAQQ